MNRNILILFFIFLFSKHSFSQEFYGAEARKIIPAAEILAKDTLLDIPTFIRFAKGSEINFKDILPWLKNNFQISSDFDLKLLRFERDELGFTHYRYQQTYKSYPIHSNIFIVHAKNELVECMNGQLFSNLDIPTEINLNENQALDKALEYVGAEIYKCQIPGENSVLKYILNNEEASYFPKGELMLVPSDNNFKSNNYRLAYRFDIYAHKPMSRQWVFVDASTGNILLTLDRIHTEKPVILANATGSADTKYSGTRTITTDYTGSTYRLRETGRGLGIETYDLNTGTNYTNTDFTDSDNNWTGINAQQDEVARDAHWGTEKTWDYFYYIHGRNSINNAGFKLLSYVHYDNNYVNAFWDGERMTYGDGDNQNSPLTTLDICAHEITHGLTENTANLTYSNQSGALNEGFSDIFGASVEFYAKPPDADYNWTIGEEIGEAFRSMSNPNLYDQPDTYLGDNWYSGLGDNGGVHYNSGVINFWYYLLCQGGSGTNDNGNAYSVTGITMAKAERIAFRTLTVYLTSSSQYANARTYSIQAALDLYGSCSQEVESTTNAWYAVGVGAAYVASPTDAEFSANSSNPCSSAPYTAQFNNLSINANSYLWYFGDGTTSTLASPSHTYTSNGTFNVKLVAYGGTCGTDSIIKNAFITVGFNTTDDTVCSPETATLNAYGTGTMKWYDSPSGGTLLGTGPSYTTPALNITTNYYVEQSIVPPNEYVGKVSKETSATLHTNNSYYLVFSCYTPVVLKTVKVYAGSTANRTIQLKNSAGTTLQSANINVPSGESRITLNFNIPVGTNMRLATGTSNPNMYRDNSGVSYPYNLDGKISITGTNAGSNLYYYYYDWEIESPSCTSSRQEVTATVNPLPDAAGAISGTANVCKGQTGITYTVPDIANSSAYTWTLPSGASGSSTTNSITVDFGPSAVSGNITVNGINDCGQGTISTFTVNVSNHTSSTINKTACESYTAPDGVVYTTSGIKTAIIPNSAGCDSTIIIDLTINQNSVSNISETACETYTAPDGATHTTSGIKTAMIENAAGCDSIITIDLTINQKTTSSISETACETYTAPDGIIHTTSGINTAIIENSAGCDSTITINLTINIVNTVVEQEGETLTANANAASYQWLDCLDNYSPLPGETAQSFTAVLNGEYAVEITENNCVDTSACYSILTVVIDEQHFNAINVFPNPFSNELIIVSENNNELIEFEIYNSLGAVIYNGSLFQKTIVQTDSFAPGVYLLKINNSKVFEFKKIIKE
ncbi:MAG: M4 family metallopeptidase [Bacteroidales bacterium]|jgi:Zn-dependent metalloprotease|nr:M4 family metallopeptidase [Bacteroidales bacterium]MDD4214081.1 M4 family metallopeptidase [Bacteroidales bacterium]